MSDITQGQFYDAIQKLRDHLDAKHTSLRESMEDGFARLDAKLDQHAKDDSLVANRVLVIETQRKEEASQVMRRSTWMALIAAAGLTAVWDLVKSLWKS